MRVFSIQVPSFHSQNLIYTSCLSAVDKNAERESTVTSHLPVSSVTANSTRAYSSGVSSRLETRFEGETSISVKRRFREGENICSDEGCEEGRMILDDGLWKTRGTRSLLGYAFGSVEKLIKTASESNGRVT
jgi:hypothetical protein